MKRFAVMLATAALLSLGAAKAGPETDALFGDGPLISKPSCEEGKCPDFKGGQTKDPNRLQNAKPSEFKRAVVSDRCYVTRRDYCVLPYYGVRGDYCECYDNYGNIYAGVVW